MQIIWSRAALTDLAAIRRYIARDNPTAAQNVASRLLQSAESLSLHPNKGRIGDLHNTRELVIPGLPYLMVYKVSAGRVEIVRVIHTARQWP